MCIDNGYDNDGYHMSPKGRFPLPFENADVFPDVGSSWSVGLGNGGNPVGRLRCDRGSTIDGPANGVNSGNKSIGRVNVDWEAISVIHSRTMLKRTFEMDEDTWTDSRVEPTGSGMRNSFHRSPLGILTTSKSTSLT
uniref:Uncharacterized protein n=1 Tax=Spongospora subterranea TaxID=70186 RepID=A0A0H5QU08_9EUKA|eukprot:CRZ05051.1 hypothetical protein [Spongospora subterranea]